MNGLAACGGGECGSMYIGGGRDFFSAQNVLS